MIKKNNLKKKLKKYESTRKPLDHGNHEFLELSSIMKLNFQLF